MSEQVIKKLASIFQKQQQILQKLAYPPISLHEARQLFGLSPDFDYAAAKEAINRYVTEHRNKPDWNSKSVTFNRALVILEDDFRYREKAKQIVQKSPQEDSPGLPDDFEEKLQHYLSKGNEGEKHPMRMYEFKKTLNQLHRMARGNRSAWEELGEYFPGWSPANVAELYKRLLDALGHKPATEDEEYV